MNNPTGRPTLPGGTGTTKNRVVRVPEPLWRKAKAKAKRERVTVSDVIRAALTEYVSR